MKAAGQNTNQSTVELGKNGMEREKEGNSTMLGCLLMMTFWLGLGGYTIIIFRLWIVL